MNHFTFAVAVVVGLHITVGPLRCIAVDDSDGISEPASDGFAAAKTRWKLRLLPERIHVIDQPLAGTRWSEKSLRDILGRGIDRFVHFPKPDQDENKIVITTVRHHGVNDARPESTEESTYPLTIAGPFLEYNGLIHSAYVGKDVIVPDAMIKVADRQWYAAMARRTAETKDGDNVITFTEYLFEFDDDPLSEERGHLTFQRYVRQADEVDGELTKATTLFARFRDGRDKRLPQEVQVGTPDKRSVTILFYADQPYALIRENVTIGSGILRREPDPNQKH